MDAASSMTGGLLQPHPQLQKSEAPEQSVKLRFYRCRPQHGREVKPTRKVKAGHRFPIFRPVTHQSPSGSRRIGRPMGGAAVQVAQQHRLEAGALPYNDDIVVGRCALRPFSTLRVALCLVVIEQHETLCWRSTCPPQVGETAHRHINPRQRIAGARPQLFDDEVDGQPGLAEQVLQESCIADL